MENAVISPDEHTLLAFRRHWMVALKDIVIVVLLALIPLALLSFLSTAIPESLISLYPHASITAFLVLLWLLLLWVALFATGTRFYLDQLIVTDKRIIHREQIGILGRAVKTIGIEHIQGVTVLKGNIFQTFFDYGTMDIQAKGAASDILALEGVPRPEEVRSVILQHMTLFDRLAAAREQQAKLLRTVSHEVKGYLSRDAAALAAIAEGDYDKSPAMLKGFAGSALSQTRKGVGAVIDLLQHADFKEGRVEAARKPFNLGALLRAIASDYEFAAKQRGVAFSVAAPESIVVEGDEDKICRLVIRNILDNAFHYTPGGSIHVELVSTGGIARLSIKDTGVGISPDDMQKLFTAGGKGARSENINPESTGFGLVTAKEIVEMHGGHIFARSSGIGQGSEFIIELPLAKT